MTPKRLPSLCIIVLAGLMLAVGACSSPAAPSPTAAPKPAPTKAPEAPKPTAAPAKAAFPEKGKAINLLVAFPAGGSTDVGARLLAPLMEKSLGTPVQVVNRGGAGGQVGWTELAGYKPDGYGIGYVNLPSIITQYLDPERKAVFKRESFQPLAMHVVDPAVIAVAADSPYKTAKDLLDAAKANPEKIKAGADGILTDDHLNILQLERMSGAKFATVQFEGGAPKMTALLGGHIDAAFGNVGDTVSQFKSGKIRVLAVLDKEENKFYPGIKTLEAQGYKVYGASSRGVAAPAGTPKEAVDALSQSIKKAMEDEDHKKKMDESGLTLRYFGPAEFEAYWSDMEKDIEPLMAAVK